MQYCCRSYLGFISLNFCECKITKFIYPGIGSKYKNFTSCSDFEQQRLTQFATVGDNVSNFAQILEKVNNSK